MGAPGRSLKGSSSCRWTAPTSVDDGGGSGETKGATGACTNAGEESPRLSLFRNSEAPQSARRSSSSVVKAWGNVV